LWLKLTHFQTFSAIFTFFKSWNTLEQFVDDILADALVLNAKDLGSPLVGTGVMINEFVDPSSDNFGCNDEKLAIIELCFDAEGLPPKPPKLGVLLAASGVVPASGGTDQTII
jgi:hypothetical protein